MGTMTTTTTTPTTTATTTMALAKMGRVDALLESPSTERKNFNLPKKGFDIGYTLSGLKVPKYLYKYFLNNNIEFISLKSTTSK